MEIRIKSNEKNYKKMKKFICSIAATVVSLTVIIGICSAAGGDRLVKQEKLKAATAGSYRYKDRYNTAVIAVPQITNETDMEGVAEVNKSVRLYTNELIKDFIVNIVTPQPGSDMPEGFHSFRSIWNTPVNSAAWFTLKITSLEIMASGNTFCKYYNINRVTGKYVRFSDLFKEGSDYISLISENIISQMMERMNKDEDAVYWIAGKNAFTAVKPDQNYYFNEKGDLVIAFDEYEVAPGYMGTPEFIIPDSTIKNLMLK